MDRGEWALMARMLSALALMFCATWMLGACVYHLIVADYLFALIDFVAACAFVALSPLVWPREELA